MKLLLLFVSMFFLACSSQKGHDVPWNFSHLHKMNEESVFISQYLADDCGIGHKTLLNENVSRPSGEQGPHDGENINYYTNKLTKKFSKENEWPFQFPEVALIVKEKLLIEKEYGAMLKREKGYDPKNGDWEYFYIESDGKVHRGKLQNCIDCHKKAADNTYVYGFNAFR